MASGGGVGERSTADEVSQVLSSTSSMQEKPDEIEMAAGGGEGQGSSPGRIGMSDLHSQAIQKSGGAEREVVDTGPGEGRHATAVW